MADDLDFFIYHPDSQSTIVGIEAFKAFGEGIWLKDEFKATDFAVRDMRIKFAELGNAAWFSCFWMTMPNGKASRLDGTIAAGPAPLKSGLDNG